MYNCARLHTLFDSYERGVEKGESCAFQEIRVSFFRSTTSHTTKNSDHCGLLGILLMSEWKTKSIKAKKIHISIDKKQEQQMPETIVKVQQMMIYSDQLQI